MVSFLASSQRARTKVFDTAKEKTAQALHNEEVRRFLGTFADNLLMINQELILPNVRHQTASLSKSQLNSNGVPFLPVLVEEQSGNGLQIGDSMLLPTPNMLERMRRVTTSVEPRRAQAMITASLAYFVEDGRTNTRDLLVGHRAMITMRTVNAIRGNFFGSRPYIAARTEIMNTSVGSTASLLTHEYVHGDDYEHGDIAQSLTLEGMTQLELRAYFADMVVRSAFLQEMSEKELAQFNVSYAVNELRQAQCSAEDPFKPNEVVIQTMQAWGAVTPVKYLD